MKIRISALVATLLIMQFGSFAQIGPELDKGDKAFDNFDFEEAMYFYDVAHEASPNDPTITRRIANTYRRMGQLSISAEWYRKTLELDASKAEDMLYYAEALKNLQQYDEAVYWYEMYDKLSPNDSRAKSHLKDKLYYKDLFADTSRYDMKRFKMNNENPIMGITLFEDEKFIVSAVNMEADKEAQVSPFLDLFYCDMNQREELSHPVRLDKKVSSKYHDGPAFYSFAEHKMYITRNNIRNGRPVRDKNGNVNLKIYEAKYENGQWSSAQELKFNDDRYSTGHASLSKDGQTMYFVSTREGGFGGSDLYVCYKAGSSWSEPVNLGAKVNTAGNEMLPFLGEDGYLYFSSDGHAGLGGLDIFSSEFKNELWEIPVNMGAPINSNMDDFALVYDKESDNGFFCSNRSGKGDDDLYFYKHVNIDRMIVAGTLKATSPNVSLAGERIQIKKLNSGETTVQSLDESERFEFSAAAGDQVEITMMNAEYFDNDSPVLKYEVPNVINDPFVNLGERLAELTKAPARSGRLSSVLNDGLAQAKAINANPLGANANTDISASKNELDPLNAAKTDSKSDLTDKSQLPNESTIASAKTPAEVSQENYEKKIADADKLFADKKYAEAKSAYLSASAIQPKEKYAKDKIAAIDKQVADDALAQKKAAYNEKIAQADKLLAENKTAEAKAAYQSAATMLSTETYAREKVAMIDKQIEEETAARNKVAYDEKIAMADKLFADQKWEEAKAQYKAAALLAGSASYPKERIAAADAAIKKAKEESLMSKADIAERKQTEYDMAEPVIDLTGMSIDNVIFDYNKALIRKEDMATLDKLYQVMKENQGTKLLIRAHCDSRGSLAYNQSLSMSRAMAVQGYLMQRGIKRERFYTEWYGEQRPLNGCIDNVPCEEDQYEVNRRAEFKLVAMK